MNSLQVAARPPMTPLLAHLHAEHKARQARLRAAEIAAAAEMAARPAPRTKTVLLPLPENFEPAILAIGLIKLLTIEITKRAHVSRRWARWLNSGGAWSRNDKIKLILESVGIKHGVTAAQIKGPCRNSKFVAARKEVYYRLRCLGLSFPRIAYLLGGRDHTTVLSGARGHARQHGLPMPYIRGNR